MTDSAAVPRSERQLVAVYEDPEAAGRVRDALVAAGVAEAAIAVDRPEDEVVSLRGEMHEEVTQAWIVPNAAFAVTKEGVKGIGVVGIVAAAVGLLVGVALASLDFGSTYPVRLVVFGGIGLTFGATVGLVAGAGMGSRRPDELAAAHRGVVLRVRGDSASLRELLARFEPIRLDEVSVDGDPIDTITTEGDRPDAPGDVEEMFRNVAVGDDYSPSDPSRAEAQGSARPGPERGDQGQGRRNP